MKFLIDKGRSIMSLAMGVISSVGAIAAGNIGAAIGGVERSLAASIPLALGFLSKLLHIGNIGSKVRGLIDKLRGKLELVMNKVIQRVAGIINKVMGKGDKAKSGSKTDAKMGKSGDNKIVKADKQGNKKGKPGETQADVAKRNKELPEAEKQKKLDKAVNAIAPKLNTMLRKGTSNLILKPRLFAWRVQYGLSKLDIDRSGGNFKVIAQVNPMKDVVKGIIVSDREVRKILNSVSQEILSRTNHNQIYPSGSNQQTAGTKESPFQLSGGSSMPALVKHYQATNSIPANTWRYAKFGEDHLSVSEQIKQDGAGNKNRNSFVNMGGSGHSYDPDILNTLNDIKSKADGSLSDEDIAVEVDNLVRNGRFSAKVKSMDAQSQISRIAYLMFGREAVRNNRVIAMSPMLTGTVINSEGKTGFKKAFNVFSMSPDGSQKAVDRIDKIDSGLAKFPGLRPPGIGGKLGIGQRVVRMQSRETATVYRWLKSEMKVKKIEMFDNIMDMERYIRNATLKYYKLGGTGDD